MNQEILYIHEKFSLSQILYRDLDRMQEWIFLAKPMRDDQIRQYIESKRGERIHRITLPNNNRSELHKIRGKCTDEIDANTDIILLIRRKQCASICEEIRTEHCTNLNHINKLNITPCDAFISHNPRQQEKQNDADQGNQRAYQEIDIPIDAHQYIDFSFVLVRNFPIKPIADHSTDSQFRNGQKGNHIGEQSFKT